ncbi:MAG: hypothetical protein A3I05_06345 [Deltaproteobacteria bacterium RIFCSPLOWO2_02_FULL_44_10]|nr:MAG: hypothetical protein A3C46_01630 [Deltaproteobacteria bacterium RIFCSPHIGHO2_02_FULL_44_16]OGQ46435.1 MAG: hypothetical protein A3I05_06345 [Deltaproteobacteria bacterium RIFCSPLOWO2_02_FULL_44_10]
MNDKQSCQCEKCRECCTRDPGWFLPEEIKPAADFLKLSEEDFRKQYCTEHQVEGTIVLAPKRKPLVSRLSARASCAQSSWSVLTKPIAAAHSPHSGCIFFRENKCSIHPVKPYECRKVFGCEGPRRHTRIRELIVRRWS